MAILFEEFSIYLEQEQETREVIRQRVRDVEQTGRQLNLILSKIHQDGSAENIQAIVAEAEEIFKTQVKDSFQKLAIAIPDGQYFRFQQCFNHSIQRHVYLAALAYYLKEEKLLQKDEAAKWLGIEEGRNFFLDVEDYLSGLTQLSNELSRFSVNAVTHGDYARPQRIAIFLGDLSSGFRLLNLKNDGLRKKFDSLKYDMKKVEEVVYDLSIRGLLKTDTKSPQQQQQSGDAKQETDVSEPLEKLDISDAN